jgi:hypothetical protein
MHTELLGETSCKGPLGRPRRRLNDTCLMAGSVISGSVITFLKGKVYCNVAYRPKLSFCHLKDMFSFPQ